MSAAPCCGNTDTVWPVHQDTVWHEVKHTENTICHPCLVVASSSGSECYGSPSRPKSTPTIWCTALSESFKWDRASRMKGGRCCWNVFEEEKRALPGALANSYFSINILETDDQAAVSPKSVVFAKQAQPAMIPTSLETQLWTVCNMQWESCGCKRHYLRWED